MARCCRCRAAPFFGPSSSPFLCRFAHFSRCRRRRGHRVLTVGYCRGGYFSVYPQFDLHSWMKKKKVCRVEMECRLRRRWTYINSMMMMMVDPHGWRRAAATATARVLVQTIRAHWLAAFMGYHYWAIHGGKCTTAVSSFRRWVALMAPPTAVPTTTNEATPARCLVFDFFISQSEHVDTLWELLARPVCQPTMKSL